jgi:hypothetical protein
VFSDYRKLTFFYYAEEYINFNELVTDLFKVYKTRIWMSAINPASYTVMNPNNIVRPQHWPRPGPTTNAAAYLRAQEEYRTSLETGRTASPIDREGPAARGNREYERLVQMANTSRTNTYAGNAHPVHGNGPTLDGKIPLPNDIFPKLTSKNIQLPLLSTILGGTMSHSTPEPSLQLSHTSSLLVDRHKARGHLPQPK